jgi:hypothetical protein
MKKTTFTEQQTAFALRRVKPSLRDGPWRRRRVLEPPVPARRAIDSASSTPHRKPVTGYHLAIDVAKMSQSELMARTVSHR